MRTKIDRTEVASVGTKKSHFESDRVSRFLARTTPDSAMTSSLATQLAQGASLNTALLVDRSKRKHPESYLFTGKEANHHDLYSIHALALNGFTHLRSVNPSFRTFEQTLLSDAAKGLDRTLLVKEKAEELSLSIGRFLRLLGPYLLDAPSGKILEWLVRRFRWVIPLTALLQSFEESYLGSTSSM